MASQANSTKHTKKNLYPSFLSFSKSLKKKEHPKDILSSHRHVNTKTRQIYYQKGKLQTNICDEYRSKNSPQNFSQLNPSTYRTIIHHNQGGFIPGSQGWFNICKSISIIHHMNKKKSQKSYDHLNRRRRNI